MIPAAESSGDTWSPANKEKAAAAPGGPYSFRLPLLQHWRLRHLVINGGAPNKLIKLFLVGLLLVCALALLSSNLSSIMGWNFHHPSSSPSRGRGGFSVLINTWKPQNPQYLKQTVAHYASCTDTDAIRVVWTARNPPSEALTLSLIALSRRRQPYSSNEKSCDFGIDFDNQENLLHSKTKSRFKLTKELTTDAIFSVNDNVIVPCSALSFAFTVWQAAPSTMVGFVPRMHWIVDNKERNNDDAPSYYQYGGWWSVWWKGTYSMVLSQAAFLHKNYLDLYSNNTPSSIKDYLMWARNCEDIAMSFLVANATGSPPIWVQGKVYETAGSSSGMRRRPDGRNRCLNDLITLYGTVPLVHTRLKAVDSRNQWFW